MHGAVHVQEHTWANKTGRARYRNSHRPTRLAGLSYLHHVIQGKLFLLLLFQPL